MRVLVVEDDETVGAGIARALRAENFAVDLAINGEDGGHLGATEAYDAVVLDLGLPKRDGISILAEWRATGRDLPVLILTARDAWADKVQGFKAGADDYLVKPFRIEELVMRLRALVRRAAGHAASVIRCGAVAFDAQTGQFELDGMPLKLTAFEWRVLSCMMLRKEIVVERLDLLERVYEGDADVDSNSLEVIVGRLRRKIGAERIETVWAWLPPDRERVVRLLPRSLFGRLLATALVAMIAALIFAAFAIGDVLERFVTHGLDDRLDAQIAVLKRAVRPDGSLDPSRTPAIPPFDEPGSGWTWAVQAPSDTLLSAPGVEIVPNDGRPPPPQPDHRHNPDRPRPFEARDGERGWVHGRMLTLSAPRGKVRIFATGPRDMVERPLHAAMVPLLLSLLLLGAAMAVAILIQLKIGLRPLGALRTALAEVRAGQRERIEASEPSELLPLVDELNALIDANRVSLAQARGHVANLAHGLKTPLAGLRLDLAARDPDGSLVRQIDRIDAHVRHHLGRARAASGAQASYTATPLGVHVDDLVAVLHRIHADRAIEVEVAIPPTLTLRCDPQDLDEMLGNLLDNGWMWARRKIRVSSHTQGRDTVIRITDDGPGLSAEQVARATDPGWRLDETSPGHGFGLTIVRELAELHGGRLTLQNERDGGLTAALFLR